MKKLVVVMGTLFFSLSAVAWEVEPPPPGTCLPVMQVGQTWDYLVLNGSIRIIKSQANSNFLQAALLDPSLIVCLGGEPDLWGNVNVTNVTRAVPGPAYRTIYPR